MAAPRSLVDTIGVSPPVDTSKPCDASTLKGKTVLITGGANGIGAAFARQWAAEGARLVIGDLDGTAGEALVAELRQKHGDGGHIYRHCDVTVWEDQVALFEEAARDRGGVDVVVANAGFIDLSAQRLFETPVVAGRGDGKLSAMAPPKPSTKVLEVNSIGLAYTAHLAMFWLPRGEPVAAGDKGIKKDRCLLLMGSIAGIIALPGQAQYCMSKHSVTGLFRALRGTAWRHGIRLNMLCPYFVGGSNMFPGPVHAALLSGSAGPASFDDVVDAATRLVADEGVSGRALAVGPRLRAVDGPDGEVELVAEAAEDGRAAWDCYAEDYQNVETFVWRYITVLNAVEKARGWIGWASDIGRFLLGR